RDLLQMLEYEPVDRLRTVERKGKAQLAIELAQRRGAFHENAAIGLGIVAAAAQRRTRRELAYQLFEYVLEGHQAFQLAVLVDHERHAVVVFLEVLQLRKERRAGR